MPQARLLSLSFHSVVLSKASRLTIATLYLQPLYFHFYTSTASSRSQISNNQPLSPEDEEEGQGQRHGKSADDDYYALLLSSPLPTRNTAVSSSSRVRPVSSIPTSSRRASPLTPKLEPRVIFGSRLAGPAARQREGWAQERPKEPDNCCMSGCVNCVWDAYREEVEEWAARRKREAEEGRAVPVDGSVGDVDGPEGGGEIGTGALFEGVPVGIQEFMALEKRLKEKDRDRGRTGGATGATATT
ncbi:hypothetical protein MMC07_006258 [Pseudocyphellaria aurata]|nr:hypothetical protein [Pseudocyphellaria aurata]